MRLFQCGYFYPNYLPYFRELSRLDKTFAGALQTLLADRTDASHILSPILSGDDTAFYTRSSDRHLQEMWARDHGMRRSASDEDILLAQLEHHRADVFYDMAPMTRSPAFLSRLPGSVKKKITWFASPDACSTLHQYDLVVSNFPSLSRQLAERGSRTAYFSPAHDEVLDEYASNRDRPVDILFVGSYSHHHQQRNELLLRLLDLAADFTLGIYLHTSRRVKLAESPLGRLLQLTMERRPDVLRRLANGPLFGRSLYSAMSRAKICVNGSISIAGNERGNMRCFEAMGVRNLLLSDDGLYPEGMKVGHNLVTYSSTEHAIEQAQLLLRNPEWMERIATAGHAMISSKYSKARQWQDFQCLAA